MMTMYLTLDAVKSGKLHMNDKVKLLTNRRNYLENLTYPRP